MAALPATPLCREPSGGEALRSPALRPSRSAAWMPRASLVEADMLVPQGDPVTVVGVVMKAALEIWSAHSDHAICLELGVSSWEGLWSTFEGCHEVLDGIRAPSARS